MAQVSVNYPVVGQANSTEDPKVVTALQALVTAINALDDANIASGANINAAKLLNSSIETGKLADNAVTTAKIADSQVTSAKIADGAIATADIANSAVTSAKIADGTIATGDIANGAVTSAKIADGTIVNGDIANGTLSPAKFSPIFNQAALGANLQISGWATPISINLTSSGTYLAIASGGFYGQNYNEIDAKIVTFGQESFPCRFGGNPGGAFAHQAILAGVSYITLSIQSTSGKQYLSAGTSLQIVRIG